MRFDENPVVHFSLREVSQNGKLPTPFGVRRLVAALALYPQISIPSDAMQVRFAFGVRRLVAALALYPQISIPSDAMQAPDLPLACRRFLLANVPPRTAQRPARRG